VTATIEPLPANLLQLGGDAELVMDEYVDVIARTIANHPRSKQVRIGPSEVGQACARRLGYKLAGFPEREQPPNWKATIGTAVHSWLEDAFGQDNRRCARAGGPDRWATETRVTVGATATLGKISGSCDLYDRVTGTVLDHKIVGPSQLKHYRASGPSAQYRTQAHLYGRGLHLLGLPVETVAICFLPRNGDISEAYLWHESWDEQVALDGLDRLEGIAVAINFAGTAALAALPTAPVWCRNCPFFKAGSTDPAQGCPGHEMPDASAPVLTFNQSVISARS